jgi:coproporphyrinogen III oxidase-like Fe-S oxidoreductase
MARSRLALARLHRMDIDGLVRVGGTFLTVTRLGRPFLRTICASFDQYIGDDNPTLPHARSI